MANYRLGSTTTIDNIISDGTLTIDTNGSGTINIGTTNAASINIGNSTMPTSFTGNISGDLVFQKEVDHNIYIDDSTADHDGYTLFIHAGNAGAGNNNGGHLMLNGGASEGSGDVGAIFIGTTVASSINIGQSGISTSIDGYLNVDGYQIDLTGGASDRQALTYTADDGKFLPIPLGDNVLIYWNGNESWSNIYNQIIASYQANGGGPTVVLDSTFNQTIPSGTYDGTYFNSTTFFAAYQGGITIDAGAIITASSFLALQLVNISLTVDGYLTQPNLDSLAIFMNGFAQIYNTNSTDPVFPQLGGGGCKLTNGGTTIQNAFFGTDGGPVFDIKAGITYEIDITNSPGGLTGNLSPGIIGGGVSSHLKVQGDGQSVYAINTSNLVGSITFTSSYPIAYGTVLAYLSVLPDPTTVPLGTAVIDTSGPYIAVVIDNEGSHQWKKAALS